MALAKELGRLQEKILFYIAEKPGQHKQAIQKSMPSKQYGSILNSVNALEKSGYIQSEEERSLKNVKMIPNSGVMFLCLTA